MLFKSVAKVVNKLGPVQRNIGHAFTAFYNTKQVKDWTNEDTIHWVREELKFTPEHQELVRRSGIRGPDLLAFSSRSRLAKAGLPREDSLWEAIQRIKVPTLASLLDEYDLRPRILSILDNQTGRDLELISEAWPAVVSHVNNAVEFSRDTHPLLFVVGAPGIGKTRFCTEFDKLLLKHGELNQHNHDRDALQLMKALKNVLYIPITFANNQCLRGATDDVFGSKRQLDWILTSRAIFQVFDVAEPWGQFQDKLKSKIGGKLPQDFTLRSLGNYLRDRFKPSMLYWHLDEINAIYELGSGKFVQAVQKMQAAFLDQSRTPTLLLFSGTMHEQQIVDLVGKTSGTHYSPCKLLSLRVAEQQLLK